MVRKAKIIKIEANFGDVAKCMVLENKKKVKKKSIKKPINKKD